MYRVVTVVAIVAAVLAVALLRRRPASALSGAECRFPWLDTVAARACALAFIGLALTGFFEVLVMNRTMHGWVLLIHVGLGGAFAAALLAFAFLRAEANAPGVASGSSGVRKAAFWLFTVSGLALIMTASLAMVPWLGTFGQLRIVDFHRWAAVAAMVGAIGYVGLAARKRMITSRPLPQESPQQVPPSVQNRKKPRPKTVARASRP